MYDVIIIGKGPAGISASLYTVRANLKTLIIGKNDSWLYKAEKIDNYFGFSESVSGKYLLEQGEKQARRIGAEILNDEVVSIQKDDYFEVSTSNEKFFAKSILLATGQPQKKINIQNLTEFEGRGVSYCSTCDGFFYNNLKVGVLGFRDYAIHEAMELLAFTNDITIYTDGKETDISSKFRSEADTFKIITKPVERIDGGEFLQKIYFKDGTSDDIEGLFVAYESASSVDFARKMGIIVDGNNVIVDRNQQTNLDGVFAAGDCTGGFKQISTAVGGGAMAGRKIIEYVKSL